jgi:hypothetical protein
MSGDALEEGGDLGDLGRRLTIMAIEQEAQSQLEAFKGDEIGYRTNRLQRDALVDEGGGRDAQLLLSGLQRRSSSWTRRAILAQVGARQAKEEGFDVRLQGSRKVRPRENIDFATPLTGDLDVRPAGKLALAGVPGPDDRVPGLLRLGPEPVVENRLVICSLSVEPLRKELPGAEATGFWLERTHCVEREGRIPTV